MSHHHSNRMPVSLCVLLSLFVLTGLVATAGSASAATICRVTTSGSSGGDGSNWTSQTMDLQTALASGTICPEVWVAKGVYKPTAGTDRSISFKPLPGVQVYGGFAGNATETQRSDRDPATNVSVLSGDIAAGGSFIDNSLTVVLLDGSAGAPITQNTVLDGFTISDGYAYAGGPAGAAARGGGLYCNGSGNGHECSPTLRNISFINNKGTLGGALFNDGSNAGVSGPSLSNVSFSNNRGDRGGAMFNDGSDGGASNPSLGNVTFSRNDAWGDGGAMFNDGSNGGVSSPGLSNVTFSENIAGYFFGHEGAIYNAGNAGTSRPILRNVIAWGNTAASGHEIYNDMASTIIHDSVIQGGCTIGDDNSCTNVITTDPKLGPLADNGGSTPSYLPGLDSPAIDAGNDFTCFGPPVNGVDQRGVLRPQGAHCDIGAVEVILPPPVISAVSGSGQQTGVWTGFFNPLVVQAHDRLNRGIQNVRLQVLPGVAGAGQPGAACSDGITDSAGLAMIYCRANGKVGGPYAINVYATDAPTIAPATFLLFNTAGDGDLIFRDGFDPPGPRTSIMAAGVSRAVFALPAPSDLAKGVTRIMRKVTNASGGPLVQVSARRQDGVLQWQVVHYATVDSRPQYGPWQAAGPNPRLHVQINATGTTATLR